MICANNDLDATLPAKHRVPILERLDQTECLLVANWISLFCVSDPTRPESKWNV